MLAYLCATAALLHLASRAGADVLTMTMSNVSVALSENLSGLGEKFYIGSKMTSLAITCSTTSNTSMATSTFTWRKFGSNVSISESRITFSPDAANPLAVKSTMTIGYPVKADFVPYVCVVNQTTSSAGSFTSVPLLTIYVNGVNDYDASHWPGEAVILQCVVNGYPTGNTVWTKSTNSSFNSTDSSIVLSSVSYSGDRGRYTCTSTNAVGTNSATVYLRVKDPQSYIAPLVSIVCEVAFMIIVIIAYEIYEKRRRRIGDGDLKSE